MIVRHLFEPYSKPSWLFFLIIIGNQNPLWEVPFTNQLTRMTEAF